MEQLLFILRFAGLLGCGLMAGVFFAFSTAVMTGLGRLEPAQGILAMQSINRAILNPLFLLVFLGTTVLSAFIIISSFRQLPSPSALYFILGSAAYLLGAFLVTAVFNIPLNNALDALSVTDPKSTDVWANYLRTWTAWNHIRAVASLAATALLTLGLKL